MRSYASSLVAACAVLQLCSASPTIIAENSDDGCHCSTELTLNIPPCTCSGVVETLAENQRLKELLKELKNNCTVDITDGFGIPCEQLVFGKCSKFLTHPPASCHMLDQVRSLKVLAHLS